MQITDEFKSIIEDISHSINKTNALLVGARNGTLTKEDVSTYLYNLMFFFHHTPIHLLRAQKQAALKGQKRLETFFIEKIKEETGHEQWAQNDLKGLKVNQYDQFSLPRVNAGTMRLLAHAKDIIDENSALFIPYMLFTEYFTVLVAPEFLDNLEKKCETPKEFMTAIAWHEELDRDHVKEDFEILSWSSQGVDPARLKFSLQYTAKYVDEMLAKNINQVF